MDDGFDGFGSPVAQRMHAHHVAAAYMREQGADRYLLRRQRHVDRAALHEFGVSRTIDERHHLAAAQALGEHRRQNVRFFRVRDGDEHIGAIDVFFQQQFFVGGIAVQDDRVTQTFGDAAGAPLIALDQFHLVIVLEPLRQSKADIAATCDDDAAHGTPDALHLVHDQADVVGRSDEKNLIAMFDDGLGNRFDAASAAIKRRNAHIAPMHVRR